MYPQVEFGTLGELFQGGLEYLLKPGLVEVVTPRQLDEAVYRLQTNLVDAVSLVYLYNRQNLLAKFIRADESKELRNEGNCGQADPPRGIS